MKLDLSPFIDNCTKDHLFKSEISPLAREKPSILGIDEAGRGPVLGNRLTLLTELTVINTVLGPMVYGLAYYPEELDKEMKNQHFAGTLWRQLNNGLCLFFVKIPKVCPRQVEKRFLTE